MSNLKELADSFKSQIEKIPKESNVDQEYSGSGLQEFIEKAKADAVEKYNKTMNFLVSAFKSNPPTSSGKYSFTRKTSEDDFNEYAWSDFCKEMQPLILRYTSRQCQSRDDDYIIYEYTFYVNC